jgi:hypothetical protein
MPTLIEVEVKRKFLFTVAVSIVTILLLAIAGSVWSHHTLRRLNYEGVQVFQVGNQKVTIEILTYSIAKGDNGPAKIIVSTGNDRRVIDSWFNHDFFTDMRPGYISWCNVDDRHGLDLLIWKREGSELIAYEYVSSHDGKLYTLKMPLRRTQ